MQHSDPCNEIFAAMAKFMGIVTSPEKDSTNQYVKSRYASLGRVLGVARPALSECGLFITQDHYVEGAHVVIETMIGHVSGQWIKSTPLYSRPVRQTKGNAPSCLDANDAVTQEKCAAFTYLRRYAALAALGLSAEGDDTDGNPDPLDGQRDQEPERYQQRGQQEQRRQEPERPKLPTHENGPSVKRVVEALPHITGEPGLAVAALSLFEYHGRLANTTPWIAFAERARALGLEPRVITGKVLEELRTSGKLEGKNGDRPIALQDGPEPAEDRQQPDPTVSSGGAATSAAPTTTAGQASAAPAAGSKP